MKKIVFLLMLLFIFGSTFAQNNKKEVIYLKNGSVLKGRQTRIDDDKVAVRSGQNIWVFSDTEIDTMTQKQLSGTFEYKSRSFFIKTTAGILAGSSNNDKSAPFSFDASFNLRLFSTFYTGLGAGVDLLENSYMPVFLNLEYHFRDSRFSPFIGFQGGYMVPLDDEISTYTYYDIAPVLSYWPSYLQQTLESRGGTMLNPSFGFVSQLNENLGLVLSFGYRFHEVTFKGEDHYKLERGYNRLSIRLGVIFN